MVGPPSTGWRFHSESNRRGDPRGLSRGAFVRDEGCEMRNAFHVEGRQPGFYRYYEFCEKPLALNKKSGDEKSRVL